MTAEDKSIDASEYEWPYTREVLEDLYGSFTQAVEEGEPKKEDAWLAMAAGYALDLMNVAREIPNCPKELLPRLLPTRFLQVCEEDGDVAFQYREMEPYKFEGDYSDEHENIDVIFELDGHDLKHETFEAIAKALNSPSDEMPMTASKPLIRLYNAAESDGVYENRIADINAYAMLVFKTSRDGITDVKILKPKISVG